MCVGSGASLSSLMNQTTTKKVADGDGKRERVRVSKKRSRKGCSHALVENNKENSSNIRERKMHKEI